MAALALGWALGWALGAAPPHRCRPDAALLPPPLRRLAGTALLRAAVPRLRGGWSPCQLYRYPRTAATATARPNGTGPCTRGWHYSLPAAGLRSNIVTQVGGRAVCGGGLWLFGGGVSFGYRRREGVSVGGRLCGWMTGEGGMLGGASGDPSKGATGKPWMRCGSTRGVSWGVCLGGIRGEGRGVLRGRKWETPHGGALGVAAGSPGVLLGG